MPMSRAARHHRRLQNMVIKAWRESQSGGGSIPDIALRKDLDDEWAVFESNTETPDGYFVLDGDDELAIDETVGSGFEISSVVADGIIVETP